MYNIQGSRASFVSTVALKSDVGQYRQQHGIRAPRFSDMELEMKDQGEELVGRSDVLS